MNTVNNHDEHNKDVLRMIEFVAAVMASDIQLEKVFLNPDFRGGVTLSQSSIMSHRRNVEKLIGLARQLGLFK